MPFEWESAISAGTLVLQGHPRLWVRPVISEGGVPVTLVWRAEDGAGGLARCSGLVEAMEHAVQVAARQDPSRRP